MTKFIISCKEADEKRIYEGCRHLVDNLPWLHEKVNLFSGDWQNSNDSILISIPSNKAFHELTSFIELAIVGTCIIIDTGSQIMATFNKTPTLSEKWKDITTYVKLYGGTICGSTFVFHEESYASAFVKRFSDLFL